MLRDGKQYDDKFGRKALWYGAEEDGGFGVNYVDGFIFYGIYKNDLIEKGRVIYLAAKASAYIEGIFTKGKITYGT